MTAPRHRPDSRHVVVDLLAFVALGASAAHLWRSPWVLVALFVALGGLLLLTRWSAATLSFYLVGFVLGPLAEWYAIRHGAWAYTGAGDRIPIWLPFAWGIAALVFRGLAEALAGALGAWSRGSGRR